MTKTTGRFRVVICAAIVPSVMVPGAFGQAAQPPGIAYQQAGAFSVSSGAVGGGPVGGMMVSKTKVLAAGMGSPEPATGSPFSASQESHSLQVLGDGTRIDRTETSKFYRDSQGRTRVENGSAGSASVVIQDPVGGFVAILDPSNKTAQKLPAPPMMKNVARAQAGPVTTKEVFRTGNAAGVSGVIGQAGLVQNGVPVESGLVQSVATMSITGPTTLSIGGADTASKPVVEDLGTQNINGVSAAGRRTTLTIAAGEIGNDKPISVVSETWYSNDLQMLVKSSNADPRFGNTTYELTGINRAEPDPGLFLIPADYTQSAPARALQFTTGPKE